MSFYFPGLSNFKIPFKYGIIAGFIFSIQLNLQHLFRNSYQNLVTYSPILFLPVLFVIIYFGLAERKRTFESSSSYSKSLQACLLITLFASIFSSIFMFIYNEYINYDWVDIMRERFLDDLRAQDASAQYINTNLKNMLAPYSTTKLVRKEFLITFFGGSAFSFLTPLLAKSFRKLFARSTSF